MSDEVQSLREALLEKEQIQGFLSTLEKLKADGSVNDEQYATLKSGYREKMVAAVSEIARVKNELAGQLLSTKQKLNHSKTELKQLKARYDSGELSPGEFHSAEEQVDNRIEDIRTEIANLQRLTEAKSSGQVALPGLAEYAEQVAASMASQTRATLEQEGGGVARAPVSAAMGGDMVLENKEETEPLYEHGAWVHELASDSVNTLEEPFQNEEMGSASGELEELAEQYETESRTQSGKKDIGYGLLWLVGGGIITGLTYVFAEPGGFFLITWGSIAYGGFLVLRGVHRKMTG